MTNIKRMLTSCFGLGRLPFAPGTWGSLPPVIIFGLMSCFGASPAMITNVMAALVLAGGFVCVQFAPAAIAATGKNDPREVVADEFAGQAVTFLFSPFLGMGQATPLQIYITAFTGFVLFRLFDISKPWPIRKLEKYPAGWGILADDLLAGVFAWIVLQIFIRFLIVI
jgi:phosphatidylglycerophosphatase A